MKTGLRSRSLIWLAMVMVALATAPAEGNARAHQFLSKVERELPEVFYIPLAGTDPAQPGKTVTRKMERDDDWLKTVSELVNDREIDFRFEPMKLDDAAEAKSYPKAFCWKRGGKCGIVLRRFQDANLQWISPWNSGENWMMIVFELMNLEGISVTEGIFNSKAELIDRFARSEFRAMDRANDVFYRSWAPYCEKVGAKVDLAHIPWFNRNVSIGEDEWSRRAVNGPELKEYREWLLVSGMHRLRERDAEIKFREME